MRELYALPPDWKNRTMQEALEWATDKIIELDERNAKLEALLAKHGWRKPEPRQEAA